MPEKPKKSPGNAATGKGLTHVFVKARANGKKPDDDNFEREFYVNLGDIACMFGHGSKTVLWRSALSGASVTSFYIPDMTIEQTAEALAAQGVALVDLKQVHEELAAKKAKNIYKPVKM